MKKCEEKIAEIDYKQIGKFLKFLRLKEKYSIEDVAKKINISVDKISNIESCKTEAYFSTIMTLLGFYGVKLHLTNNEIYVDKQN